MPKMNQPCRIYAPVGSHEDLLAYLVRRLLENGANTSFVNRLADDEAPIAEIIADPVEEVAELSCHSASAHSPAARHLRAARQFAGLCRCGMIRRAKRCWPRSSEVLAKPVKPRPSSAARPRKGGRIRTITAPHDRRM